MEAHSSSIVLYNTLRLLKEMRALDLLLSQQAISEFLLYMSRMSRHMERIGERMPPAQSSKNIRGEKSDSHDQQQGH